MTFLTPTWAVYPMSSSTRVPWYLSSFIYYQEDLSSVFISFGYSTMSISIRPTKLKLVMLGAANVGAVTTAPSG